MMAGLCKIFHFPRNQDLELPETLMSNKPVIKSLTLCPTRCVAACPGATSFRIFVGRIFVGCATSGHMVYFFHVPPARPPQGKTPLSTGSD